MVLWQKLKDLFYPTVSLGLVRDRVAAAEGADKLYLIVSERANTIMHKLGIAQKGLESLNNGTEEKDRERIALQFASAILGEKQAQELLSFYQNDPNCVIDWCGKYFSAKLSKKITKAQKKNMQKRK